MPSLRTIFRCFNLLLVVAASYAASLFATQVLENALAVNSPAPLVARQSADVRRPKQKLPPSAFQSVLDANVFRARRSDVKPSSKSGPAPPGDLTPVSDAQAPLDVILAGTVTVRDRSFAMVADGSGRNEKLYRLWDCLPAEDNHPTRRCSPAQGKLMAVRKDRISVRYQGQLLRFRITDKPLIARPAARRAAGRRTNALIGQAKFGGAATFPITREGNVLEIRVPRAEVTQAFENFSDVLKQARIVPYTGAGGPGFQIRKIRSGSIFQRIGLNNFDIIKAVNGEPIATADQALRLLTMFRNEKELTLDLQRRNQQLQLNYIIE